MNIVVTGIGLISALGSLEPTWKNLLKGHSGITLHQPFPELAPKPLALIGQYPARLENLTAQIIQDAIADAKLALPLPDCAIVIGSSRGHQSAWEKLARLFYAPCSAPPALPYSTWLDTLPHTAAVTAAHLIGTQAAVRSPMAACATGLWAIAQGYDLIQSGEYDQVIAGAVEAPITPLTLTGFAQMGALAQTGAFPFDRDREGLVLGEGGAVLVLESEASARQRNAQVYGRIVGVGLTADSYHISTPEPGSQAAITAVTHCLQRSNLTPQEIHFIHAHGTATRLNDQNEAQLIQTLFSPNVPVSSTKGATGHAIGGSGALGVALCLMALQQQQLPPTVGLTQPDFDLNFVRQTQPAHLQNALCLGFGFGGQNAAIALATL
ncbi:MAG: beta-ketoacyl-ACP synthase [Leptolyngbyaceae cyanobacterium bins.349]|nr:beta-ketoacyl-ACP synthase [Leptolyngbyaceae cyanobacterium bins.349]